MRHLALLQRPPWTPHLPRLVGPFHQSSLACGFLIAGFFLLALAACQPGGVAPTSEAAPTSSPTSLAPIHVPAGYQGFIEVTFRPTTTYAEALSVLQRAGLQAQVQCPGPGPAVAPPMQTDQQRAFSQTHQLSAVGTPTLTTSMLTQVASAPQVVSVEVAPKFVCPD